MIKHLAKELQWHDNKWNGERCDNPELNLLCPHRMYCIQGGSICPPCFSSVNAFSNKEMEFQHRSHIGLLKKYKIDDTLNPYSVFVWPKRLSYCHSIKNIKKHGKYPDNFDKRINGYFKQFKPGYSLIFFYLSQDNPISIEKRIPVLVGCSLINKIEDFSFYDYSENDLMIYRNQNNNKNFTNINWAVQVRHNYEEYGVVLPYHEYLKLIEEGSFYESYLNQFQILLSDKYLEYNLKNDTEELDDDRAIYLLYKLRNSLSLIKGYGIINVDKQLIKVDKMLAMVWKQRGKYPGLASILRYFIGDDDINLGDEILDAIISNNEDLSAPRVFELISAVILPDYLAKYKSIISSLRRRIGKYEKKNKTLSILSHFCLSEYQVGKILKNKHAFVNNIKYADIVSNPYVLSESYVPDNNKGLKKDLLADNVSLVDGPISLHSVDIGLFPDEQFVFCGKNQSSFDLDSPERTRSIIYRYLQERLNDGDCFVSFDDVIEHLNKPQYRLNQLIINRCILADERYLKVYNELFKIEGDRIYLLRIYNIERNIERRIKELIDRPDYLIKGDLGKYISELFAKKLFAKEEDAKEEDAENQIGIAKNIYSKSISILTGVAGTGKSTIIIKLIMLLNESGDNVTVLAPTGKATFLINDKINKCKVKLNVEAMTIDKFIYAYTSQIIEDYIDVSNVSKEDNIHLKGKTFNIIIDESSMLDIYHLFALFKLLGEGNIKRLILVGDNKQLPPVGAGRPFNDVIDYIQSKYPEFYNKLTILKRNKNILEIEKEVLSYINGGAYYGDRVSKYDGVKYVSWDGETDLFVKMIEELEIISSGLKQGSSEYYTGKNIIHRILDFGLSVDGSYYHNRPYYLRLDEFQIISPYNSGTGGVININNYFSEKINLKNPGFKFTKADKVICNKNLYRKESFIANGTLGIYGYYTVISKYRGIILEDGHFINAGAKDMDHFSLAYAITVHKSQGSGFSYVFFIVPQQRGRLSNELIYTGISRHIDKLVVFIQNNKDSKINVSSYMKPRNSTLLK